MNELEVWKWWDSLRERSTGTYGGQDWSNIWIGVMLRRCAEQHPENIGKYRTAMNWMKVIERQATPQDVCPPAWLEGAVHEFFGEPLRKGANTNHWQVVYRIAVRWFAGGETSYKLSEYAITKVLSLEDQIKAYR